MMDLLESELFKCYAIHVGLLMMKMYFLVIRTILARLKHKAYHTPEDAVYLKSPMRGHDEVERIRKCHLNGIENEFVFAFIAFLYATIQPTPLLATWLFRLHTCTRYLHTYVYAVHVQKQPARAYTWMLGFVINGYMMLAVVWSYWNYF